MIHQNPVRSSQRFLKYRRAFANATFRRVSEAVPHATERRRPGGFDAGIAVD